MEARIWGAFIEKRGCSEEEILERIGYSTKKVIKNNLDFISVPGYLMETLKGKGDEIFTLSTSEDYLILIDLKYKYSSIGGNVEEAKKSAQHFKYDILYKFEYETGIGIKTFAKIVNGKLRRYIHEANHYGKFEYGEPVEIEPTTKKSYFTESLFGELEEIVVEEHNPFEILDELIGILLEKVTGKFYHADYFDLEGIKLDRRIVKKIEPVNESVKY